MLNLFFRKRGTPDGAAAADPSKPAPGAALPGADKAAARARRLDEARAQWAPRLEAARGDDAALLAVAREATVTDIRVSAIESIASAEVLRAAEKSLRHQDGRVYKAVRQRLDALAAVRRTRATALGLIDAATALAAEATIPANRLVSLDREWGALDVSLLEPSQRERFVELRGSLDARIRERDERRLREQRANVPSAQDAGAPAVTDAIAAAEAAKEHDMNTDPVAPAGEPQRESEPGTVDGAQPSPADPGDGAFATAGANAAAGATAPRDASPSQDAAPAPEGAPAPEAAAASEAGPEAPPAMEASGADPVVSPETAVVEAAPVGLPSEADSAAGEGPVTATDAVPAPGQDAADAAEAPADAAAGTPTSLPEDGSPADASQPPAGAAEHKTFDKAALERIDAALKFADAALAAGHLAELQQHLQTLDAEVEAGGGARLEGGRRKRRQTLHSEFARLKQWQRWGDGQALETLIEQAEALARVARPPAEPKPGERAPKLRLKEHGDSIQALRKRWKELEHLGASPAQPAWRRFDAALQVAYEPIARQQAALKAARQQNLEAREALLAALEAAHGVAVPGADAAPQAPGAPAATPATDVPEATAEAASDDPTRRDTGTALAPGGDENVAEEGRGDTAPADAAPADADAVQPAAVQPAAVQPAAVQPAAAPPAAARVDGAQHDAAHDAHDGPAGRWRALIRALDHFHTEWRKLGPLEHTVPGQARGAIKRRLDATLARVEGPLLEARREAKTQREALVERAQALVEQAGARDLVQRVRALQAEWQQHARSLPLARADETALWSRFKTATDAVFAQRSAAAHARESATAGVVSAREALLARLAALSPDTPAHELRRELAEIDREWRRPDNLPRGTAIALDNRYRDLRAAASRLAAGGEQRRWHARIDVLAARLELCEAREAGGDEAELAQRRDALAPLPADWNDALAKRWRGEGALPPAQYDERLLQIEASLDVAPTPETQAARRQLKLRAMKEALEARRAPGDGPADRGAWLCAVLRQPAPDDAGRARVRMVLSALRGVPPASVGVRPERD